MGMWGSDDPDCRKPLWWKEYSFKPETRNNFQPGKKEYDPVGFNQEQFDFYKKLIAIRRDNPVLSTGDFEFVLAEGNRLEYKRWDKDNEIFVLFNLEDGKREFCLPEGTYTNLLNDYKVTGSSLSLEALSAVVLKKITP